jgi:hypothetical protein
VLTWHRCGRLRPSAPPQRLVGASRDAPMRTSVVTFDSRLLRRFRYLAADASLYARDDDESVRVEQLAQAVEAGSVTLRDGYACLAALRRQQQAAA